MTTRLEDLLVELEDLEARAASPRLNSPSKERVAHVKAEIAKERGETEPETTEAPAPVERAVKRTTSKRG